MNERAQERRACSELRPRTGNVQVSPQLARERNQALDALIEQAMITQRALKIAVRTLKAISEEKTLAGIQAMNTLEQIEAAIQPKPNLRPTYDHAGPDY